MTTPSRGKRSFPLLRHKALADPSRTALFRRRTDSSYGEVDRSDALFGGDVSSARRLRGLDLVATGLTASRPLFSLSPRDPLVGKSGGEFNPPITNSERWNEPVYMRKIESFGGKTRRPLNRKVLSYVKSPFFEAYWIFFEKESIKRKKKGFTFYQEAIV